MWNQIVFGCVNHLKIFKYDFMSKIQIGDAAQQGQNNFQPVLTLADFFANIKYIVHWFFTSVSNIYIYKNTKNIKNTSLTLEMLRGRWLYVRWLLWQHFHGKSFKFHKVSTKLYNDK